MNCESAREAILEAAVADLEARDDNALGRHLRDCGECRRAAQLVSDGMTLLGRNLGSELRLSADRSLARIGRERTRSAYGVGPWVAAASILLALVMSRAWRDPSPHSQWESAGTRAVAPPVIEDAGGARVAMFATTNPQVTVAWFYEENTR